MNQTAPPKIKPRLRAAPKIRQLYWCDFPKDAQLPELWKRRPVVIISKTATLYGTVVVVPCSTQPNQDPRLSCQLKTTIDGRAAWAICDKPTTVAVSRLTTAQGEIPRLSEFEFDDLLTVFFSLLPELNMRKRIIS
jgi:mRNA interferase MazF